MKIVADYKRSFGSYVWDMESRHFYLDFVNHYSSLALGYDRLPKEFYEEVNDVAHIKTALGLYETPEYIRFQKEFCEFAVPKSYTHIHFCCTGSLAIEAAVKTAWVYAHDMKRRIVTIKNNFHGINSFGNYLTTRTMDGRMWGVPMAGWASDVSSLEQLKQFVPQLRDDVAAIIIEPIQCTNGDIYYDKEFFKEVRQLCDEQNVVLIFDEVQTGFCATGKVWYHEHIGVEPDIIVFGKKAQVSGILVKEKFAKISNTSMKLSVTFDGDLIDAIRCKYIIRKIKEQNLLDNIVFRGKALRGKLMYLNEIKNIRGMGGLIAFDLETQNERDTFKEKCREYGLLVNSAGEKTIRLRPNLAVTEDEIKKCFEIIKFVISKMYL